MLVAANTGLEYSAHAHYFPKWTGVAVTLSMVGTVFLCFALAVRYLNVFETEPSGEMRGVEA
jgi:Ni/Fe-hydrogenase subunit HybB-like protein